jgi:hypothetical protein
MTTYILHVLILLTLGISAYSFYKLRRVHLILLSNEVAVENARLFRQLEALQGLYVTLGLKMSLPPTRDWAGSPDFLLTLAKHALRHKPQTVVECSSGVSTVVLARCMQINGSGKVYSLESDPEYAQKTRDDLADHGLLEWAIVFDAPMRSHSIRGESWPWYSEEVLPQDLKINMLAIDGPPRQTRSLARYPAGPILFPRLTEQTSVFLDDSLRTDEKTILKMWQEEFPNLKHSAAQCEKGCAVLQR